jgi:hypothetical protein
MVEDAEGVRRDSISGKDMLGIEDEIYIPRPWGEIRGAARR